MPDNSSAADSRKPRGRWYQFRLRTLLIGVVLIGAACGYLAHEAKIVRDRKSWLAAHGPPLDYHGEILPVIARGDPDKAPSLVRIWLGDEARRALFIVQRTADERAGWAELFPEATICAWQTYRHDDPQSN